MRHKLPDRRRSVTQRMKVNGQTVHFTIGTYPDGSPGEIFIDMHKTGSTVKGWCAATAKLISLMLQYGVPLSELVDALVDNDTERVTVTGHPVICDTSGILDAILRSMAQDYLVMEKPEPVAWHFLSQTESLSSAELCEAAEVANESHSLTAFLEKFV